MAAGGTSSVEALQAQGTRSASQLVAQCHAFQEMGVEMIMIEVTAVQTPINASQNLEVRVLAGERPHLLRASSSC